MRRMHANAASRICWYSTSVRVCAGATVIDSPVCTPIGSRFSIEHTTTTLSAWSRMTSSSYSFQPATERSIRISETGLAARPCGDDRELLVVVRDAGAAATEDERRAHDEREPDLARDVHRFGERVRGARRRHGETDLLHRDLEPLPVFGGLDGVDARADQLDAELVEHAGLVQLDREVERGLPAERRQQRVGPFDLDHPPQRLDVERLDVGRVGELGVGHDRRRVRVHEHDAVALFAQHPARLRARVVELARLADDDRAAADEQDRLDVVAARHQLASRMRSRNSPKR